MIIYSTIWRREVRSKENYASILFFSSEYGNKLSHTRLFVISDYSKVIYLIHYFQLLVVKHIISREEIDNIFDTLHSLFLIVFQWDLLKWANSSMYDNGS